MQRTRPSILYVDDEQFNLTAFSAAFRHYYTIFTAVSAQKAIDILKQQKEIALIITDQRMPEMTGVQFIEAIINEYPEPVRMILTGFTDVDAIKTAINKGHVLRYITKPWDADELKQIIDMGIKVYQLENYQRNLIKKLEDGIQHRKKAIELFKNYIPEDIINKIIQQKESEFYTAELRITSIVCINIENLVTESDKLPPAEIIHYLNSYFFKIINIIFQYKGTVYKLIDERIIAIFGAPVSLINNKLNAIQCSFKILTECEKITKSQKLHVPNLSLNISISSGHNIVGHILSKDSINYVCIGKSNDIVDRIQSSSIEKQNSIIIDEETYIETKNDIEVIPLNAIKIDSKLCNIYKVIKINKIASKE